MSLFNESMVSCYLYTLLTLTDFHVTDKNLTRDHSGWALTIILLFTVFVNLMKFLTVKFLEVKTKCRLRQMRARKGVVVQQNLDEKKDRARDYASEDLEVKEIEKEANIEEP